VRDDEVLEEAAQRISAIARGVNAATPTVQQVALRLTKVLRALNENPSDLYVLARAHGRKFPGDRGYRWYHFKRWVRGQERWPW
jgi:hypothetical protein